MSTVSSASPRRYLALWFPFLPADRQRRTSPPSPAQAEAPLVLVEKVSSALRLAAVDRQGFLLGLTPGLTLADARARIPHLVAVDMDRAADAALLARLADWCDRYTPLVAIEEPDGLVLDITGCVHLFASEAGLRRTVMQGLARGGLTVRGSVAGTPQAAAALARFGRKALGRHDIVPPGEEEMAVRPLPAAALGVSPEVLLALTRAGLKTVGDLAERPRAPLAARFGADLPVRLARILGQEDIGISPRRPLPPCLVERRFAEPVAREEDIDAALAGLAHRAGRILAERGEGGRRFEAAFFRADGRVTRLAVATGRPARDAAVVMRLFRERLAALADPLDPGFGFDLLRLAVTACEPLGESQVSLDGRTVEDEEVAALIDRLGARFGAAAVLRPAFVDTHIPERAVRMVPAALDDDGTAPPCGWPVERPADPPARPVHLFDPPQPIEALAEVPDGPPLRFRWRRVLHEIARAEGPERIAPEWWRDEAGEEPTRDYYRVEDARGRRFWVFRQGLFGEAPAPRWFLHGIFA
ncbi:Y-family DNA polymerase [Chelatococcus daeguensis]|uniref:Y-family DNA polymerase n=1 Tax=Chelatococcus daeguensis TaxID=444444 RepID=UPI00164733AF|nr:DNA polymerase Y family protein [Chelatococcus daeguensis]